MNSYTTLVLASILINDRNSSTYEYAATISVNGSFVAHATTGASVVQANNVVHSPNADGSAHSYTYKSNAFNGNDVDYRVKTLIANGKIVNNDEIIVRNDRGDCVRSFTVTGIEFFHGNQFSWMDKKAPADLSMVCFAITERKFGRVELPSHYRVQLTKTRTATANGITQTFVVCRDTMGLAWG